MRAHMAVSDLARHAYNDCKCKHIPYIMTPEPLFAALYPDAPANTTTLVFSSPLTAPGHWGIKPHAHGHEIEYGGVFTSQIPAKQHRIVSLDANSQLRVFEWDPALTHFALVNDHVAVRTWHPHSYIHGSTINIRDHDQLAAGYTRALAIGPERAREFALKYAIPGHCPYRDHCAATAHPRVGMCPGVFEHIPNRADTPRYLITTSASISAELIAHYDTLGSTHIHEYNRPDVKYNCPDCRTIMCWIVDEPGFMRVTTPLTEPPVGATLRAFAANKSWVMPVCGRACRDYFVYMTAACSRCCEVVPDTAVPSTDVSMETRTHGSRARPQLRVCSLRDPICTYDAVIPGDPVLNVATTVIEVTHNNECVVKLADPSYPDVTASYWRVPPGSQFPFMQSQTIELVQVSAHDITNTPAFVAQPAIQYTTVMRHA